MPKKQWTDEERKAFGEKMRQARENKNEKEIPKIENATVPPVTTVEPSSDNADINELLQRIKELEAHLKPKTEEQGISVGRGGTLVGTYEKYATTKGTYPSPVERLSNEQRLQRFAFKDNFELDFNVGISSYQTIDGINTREPKFTLKLIRIVYDDDTGDPTDKRYVASTMIFHEDPDTALTLAEQNDIPVTRWGEAEFLNEMRYLRMRDWLLECFYPEPVAPAVDKKEMVMGNRLVEVYTISSEHAEKIPFSTLSKKL